MRELENEMQRVVALAEPRETVTPQRLSARQLGLTREGLYKKMKRLGIE